MRISPRRLLRDGIHLSATWAIQGRLAGGRAVREVGVARLIFTGGLLALAAVIAVFSWSLPLFGDAERGLYDLRAWAMAPVVSREDPRIVLVEFTEETMSHTERRSPVDRGLLARALTQLDAMGPTVIGIDVLIDQAQAEDRQLGDALRGMKTPTFLGFASKRSNPENIADWQERFENRFMTAAEAANPRVSRASVRVTADSDTVIRRWPLEARGDPALLSLSLASPRPPTDQLGGPIRWRRASRWFLDSPQDHPVFASIPIHRLFSPDEAALARILVHGRYVLIGARLSDSDRKKTPATLVTGETTPGLEIHAAMLAQALDNRFPSSPPPWLLTMAGLLVVVAGGMSGVIRARLSWAPVTLGGQMVAVALIPPLLQSIGVDTLTTPQFGWLAGWLIAFMATGAAARSVSAEQRRFAQSALGKYLPQDIAEQILRDPTLLALHGERRAIYAVFSDLEGFTSLTHAHEPEVIAPLVNAYLNLISQTVRAHGGTIDKFVGDAVVAFWGAPIEKPDDGERAARAAIAMWRVGEAFRRTPADDRPPLGRTRVGLHHGEAIVGNFGGEVRMQYTALGDVMNTASRLEGANKALRTRVLISREALPESMEGQCRAMGRIVVRGRSRPLVVYEPALDFPEDALARLNAAWERFDAGEVAALDVIGDLARAFPDDQALALLVERLEKVGPRGAFNLS